jgi:hypothetical protein
MEEEDISLLRIEWAKTVRAKMMKKALPNAPKRNKCKRCKKTYANPLLQGGSIATSMCEECIKLHIKKKKVRTKLIEKIEIKEEELKTLREYLEMKI